MDAQTFKYPAAKQEAQDGEYPEISSPSCMLEEPGFHKKRISVSGNNIVHRIQFQDLHDHRMSLKRRSFHDPHDRCKPHSYLKYNIDDLCQVPEKDYNGTGGVG